MSTLVASIHAEWGKAWGVRAPLLWLLAAVVAALFTATTLANDFAHAVSTGELAPVSTMPTVDAFGPGLTVAQILIVVFAIHLVTPEYSSGSIAPAYLAQPRRSIVVAAKAIVASLTALITGLALGPLTVLASHLMIGDALGDPLSLGQAAIRAAGALAPAAVIGVALGFLTRSAVASLATALVLLGLTIMAPGDHGLYLPGFASMTFLTGGPGTYGHAIGFLILTGWALGLLVLAAVVTQRRDA
ncbi:MAG: hypothetical protein LBM23_08595 [Propionibacteriaceae bacterium]|jgi:hypothetical protein|nr:hypothetical protein [Propionibacteriaceae bacterium]